MAEEERKRRRGRRRGRAEGQGVPPPQVQAPMAREETAGDVTAESEGDVSAESGGKSRFSLPFRRSGGAGEKHKERAASHHGSTPSVEPMDFWRSGTVRPYRQQTGPKKKQSLWKRVSGFYFPAWVPVVAIIVVVFGILGLLFVTRSATGAPRIGKDHWHATYQFFVCGVKQPNAPTWESGVHTHGDGVVHIHPFRTFEEGSGARLSKWFNYGGGELKADSIRMPGSSKALKNGDKCTTAEGVEQVGELQLFATGVDGQTRQLKGREIERYLPHDGDRIRLVFGPAEAAPTELDDRTIIPEEQATRTINITVTDNGASDPTSAESSTRFDPPSIEINQGETVKLVIKNTGSLSHGYRLGGDDGKYSTKDDFVSNPDLILPGGEGSVVIRLNVVAKTEFRDESIQQVTGQFVVKEGGVATPSPTPAPEAVDVELSMGLKDSFYDPASLTVDAGKKFRINLTNSGTFVHNVRFAGPDGQYETEDDILSDDLRAGQTGDVVAKFDDPGQYPFRCDFHVGEGETGVLTVQ